ncbi:hypothetical protein [Roseibium sp. MMSF_3412]|uniref:hypothetical protein n=1 Tax=Roseibium sp. MMSF_3412 TaxID=3046712 RepID=UPI0034DE9BD4
MDTDARRQTFQVVVLVLDDDEALVAIVVKTCTQLHSIRNVVVLVFHDLQAGEIRQEEIGNLADMQQRGLRTQFLEMVFEHGMRDDFFRLFLHQEHGDVVG